MRIHVLNVSCVGLGLWLSVASAQTQQPPIAAPEAVAITGESQEPPPPPPPPQPGPRGQVTPQPATVLVAPQPRAQTPPPPARMQGQPINVRIELTITDQTGTAPAAKKTVLMTVADEERGSIRSTAQISRGGPVQTVPLSVDATPTVLSDSRVRVRLSLDYDVAGAAMGTAPFLPPGVAASEPEGKPRDDRWGSQVRQSLGVVLASGVPLIVAQSADPQTDRRVSLEVKATILK
ncbi:MAG: hypothetical protein HYZ58_04425 [Acidobacteria bacterium]|nr:hypothetical protein [Acidobacteriota bacterium]MBI3262379.1 hypothetical protein [Acidobacteriota bacterium]